MRRKDEGKDVCIECESRGSVVLTASNFGELLTDTQLDFLISELAASLSPGKDTAASLSSLTCALEGYVIPVPTLVEIALTHIEPIATLVRQAELSDALRKIAGALGRLNEDELEQQQEVKSHLVGDEDGAESASSSKRAKKA